jgi:hypothetical protein
MEVGEEGEADGNAWTAGRTGAGASVGMAASSVGEACAFCGRTVAGAAGAAEDAWQADRSKVRASRMMQRRDMASYRQRENCPNHWLRQE